MTTMTAEADVVIGVVDSHQEAAFAALCGSNPIPASSGKITRHRLNRGGERHANAALWRIVVVRMSYDKRAPDDVARRTAAGKTTPEMMRCLERDLAREIYLELPPTALS